MPDYTDAERQAAREAQTKLEKDAAEKAEAVKKARRDKLAKRAMIAGGVTGGLAGAYFFVVAPFVTALNGEPADNAPNQAPGVSAPEVPGNSSGDVVNDSQDIFVNPAEAGFYGEVPSGFETPIYITDDELATLNSDDFEKSGAIYDEKLVPAMNAAITAVLANGGSAEGLNFSNVINDENTIAQLEDLVSPYVKYGSENLVDQTLQLCDTAPNDGSRNFCGPLQASMISVDENIIWDIYASNVDNHKGEEKALKTAMQPRIYEGDSKNKLIIATDAAIRSDF